METVLVAVLLLLVVVVANVGVRHEARSEAREQLRALPVEEGATRFEVVLWLARDIERPEALGVLDCSPTKARLAYRVLTRGGYPLRGGEPDFAELGRGDYRIGGLRPYFSQWRFALERGTERWLVADASLAPARTLAVREALGAALAAEKPLLAFGELPSLAWTGAASLWGLAIVLAALGVVGVSMPVLLASGLSTRSALPFIFTPPVFLVALVALAARARRRRGRVEFYERGVLLVHHGAQAIAWSELRGFDDGAADTIELHATSGKFSLPVWREHERVEALALLDRRGVQRVEE